MTDRPTVAPVPTAGVPGTRPQDFGIGGLLRRVRDAAIVADVEAERIVLWNPAAEKLFGYSDSEALGLPVEVLVPERFKAQHRAGFARYRATGHGRLIDAETPAEVAALRKTGEEIAVELTLSLINHRPAEGRFVLAIIRDVTERKRVQEAEHLLAETGRELAASLDYEITLQNVARLAVRSLADWCVVDIVEPEGSVRRLAVAHGDPARAELATEVRQSSPDLESQGPLATVLRTGQSEFVAEVSDAWLERFRPDAERLHLLRAAHAKSVMIVPLLARGRILGAISYASERAGCRYGPRDLALAEEIARRAALAIDNAQLYREAQRAVRVREEFLASASHELRTPLTAIKGFVSTLRQTDVEWDEETQQELLAEIEHDVDHLARLVGDLLDISRIESGGFDPRECRRARLRTLAERGIERVRPVLGQRRIVVNVPRNLPPAVVDAAQVERVVANLVENAAKYSPPGAPVRVVGAVVDGELELRVEDEGSGIRPEHLGRVFERFFRGRSERTRTQGTGLGLPISRRIVEAHGGRIWAENRPGGGACFVVRFPNATAAPADPR